MTALTGKWWAASGGMGNVLTPSSWSVGGQPAYNDTYVRVEAVSVDAPTA